MFGKIFGNKKPELADFDLSVFGVDMHSHLIPGIDDGSKSMDQTIAMLVKFQSLGYQKVISTPHVMSDYYRNKPQMILRGLEDVRSTAKELNLEIQIDAAAEYYFDETLLERLEKKRNC